MNNFIFKNKYSLIYYVSVVFFMFTMWNIYTSHLDLTAAYNGWSPYEWIMLLKHQELNLINFPSGIGIYESSLYLNIYKLAGFLHIDILTMMKVQILFELSIIFFAIEYLVRVLFEDIDVKQQQIITLVIYLYFTAGYMLFPEISRFTPSYETGLYYNVATALRLFAIALFLKQRYIYSGIILSLSLLTHPVYGILGASFILIALIVSLKDIKKEEIKNIIWSISLFIVVLVLYYLYISNTALSSTQIPSDQWYFWALFGQAHWFPIEMGLFSDFHAERLLGFMLVSLLFLYSLSVKKDFTKIDKQVVYAWLFMIILSIIGLLVSYYKPSPFLTKLALTRASYLALQISSFYIVYTFITLIFKETTIWIKKAIFITLLVTPFLIKAPFPLYLVFILLTIEFFTKKIIRYKKILMSLSFLIISFIVYIYLNGYLDFSKKRIAYGCFDRYIGNEYILYIFIASLFITLIYKIINIRYKKGIYFSIIAIAIFSIVLFTINNHKKSDIYINMAKDYKITQQWAKENTDKKSIFMIDPTLNYGWRAYSQRASFGTLREWIHTSWLYSGDYNIFKEGMKRFNEYGINIKDKRYKVKTLLRHYHTLNSDVRHKFYTFDEKKFQYLAHKYGIDYIVMQKKYIKKKLKFKIVYENKHFMVYKIND